MEFKSLVNKINPKKQIPNKILCLDPGHTTGIAFFIDGELFSYDQIKTVDTATSKLNMEEINSIIYHYDPDLVICENYRVYQHKLNEHSFSEVMTLRLIGIIEYLCWKNEVPIHYQMAHEAKTFCTDNKLKIWGYYIKGMRHSRDAIRHGCYYLLFNKKGI